MLEGVIWTLSLVGGGLLLGFAIGVPFAILRVYGGRLSRFLVDIYVWVYRSIPLIVLLFLYYWGIFPIIFGVKLSAMATSILALGTRDGAYQSMIFRAALESIDPGQMLAARSLGMGKWEAVRRIILPQALRIAIPGWTNQYAIMLKDSSICFALGVLEILTRTRYVTISIGSYFIPYLVAGLLFIALTYGGTKVFNIIYEKVQIPGLIGGK
ncbi:MAG: amino acid ABC transporter permease [Fervidicoccaceae archaeon]|jgi:polar amino acid transport system permease protein|nr:MAG: polar amino acid ABC transporter permease [Fervidicoccus sp.]